MHEASMILMKDFMNRYVDKDLMILDVGSQRVKSQSMYYKTLLPDGCKYDGLDMSEGLNVDIVVKNPYSWSEVASEKYDVVISGQALEHAKFPWLVMQEIYRVLKPNGICCIIVPSMGFEHRFPYDCFRYLPDGLRALGEYAGLEVLECGRNNIAPWRDCRLIGRR